MINKVKKAMLLASETNDRQKSAHTVIEESKAITDVPSDDLMRNSIKTGIDALLICWNSKNFSFLWSSTMTSLWIDEISPTSPTLLAWSSIQENKISIVDLETKQEFVNFDGIQFKNNKGSFLVLSNSTPLSRL